MIKLKKRLIILLRSTEKYTKTDMMYLAKSGAWSALGIPLSLAISFCTALAFANLIPKETFGTYQYVLSVVGILGILTLSGMGTAIARAAARGKDGSLFEALREKVKWGLLGGLASLCIGAYYFSQDNELLGWAFSIAGLFIPFWEAPGIYLNYAQGKRRFDISAVYDVIAQFLAAIAVIAALFWSKNLIVILFAYLAGWMIGRALLFYATVKQLPPNNESEHGTISYGKHLTVMSMFSKVAANVDTFLLWHTVGPATIAAYVFAQALPLRAAGLMKVIDRIAFPKMATQDMATMQKTLPHKVFLMCGIALLMAVTYAATAPYLFRLFFPAYTEAILLTQVLSLLIALQPLGLFLSPLTAHAKQNLLYLYNFLTPLSRAIVFLLLIPPFGIWGAVIGLVLAKALDGGLLMVLFYRV